MSASALGSRAIIGKFFAALQQLTGQVWLEQVSMLFDSNQESETYKWLGQIPAMREFVGGRNANAFTSNGITIVNKVFEATLQVLVDEIRRDKTGQVQIRINELAQRAMAHWTKLISTLISNGTAGTSGLCYDGQYFFDTDHTEGKNTTSQLNLLASAQVAALDVTTAAAPTALESAKAILGVIGYMMGFLDNEGEPMNENAQKFLVMTSPALWQHLAGGVHSQYVGSGESNPVSNIMAKEGFDVQIVANARLSYTTQFVVFRTDAPAKAFIRQEEKPITISAEAEGSHEEFANRRHLYGIEAIRNVGYGYWQYAAHATLS